MNFRIGHGYDVHRLVFEREFVLFGEKLEFDKGLLGHSDADVGIHAIIDSLLGAAGLGDIGLHFPDNDLRYKNIDSKILLREVSDLLKKQKYEISNIDCTVILEEPKIGKYISKMRENICKALRLDVDQVNIKATTEEGLGFTGAQQGVAAHAVALIFKNQ